MSVEFSRPVKIDSIDAKGRVETITATDEECHALAKRFDIQSVESVKATVKLKPQGDRMTYHATGELTAAIIQTCAISAQDIHSAITETFEAWYVDQQKVTLFSRVKAKKDQEDTADEFEMPEEKDDPEVVTGGTIDVGELTAQYLALAIDPYLRAEDVDNGNYIEVKPEDKPNAFAALAALKKKD